MRLWVETPATSCRRSTEPAEPPGFATVTCRSYASQWSALQLLAGRLRRSRFRTSPTGTLGAGNQMYFAGLERGAIM